MANDINAFTVKIDAFANKVRLLPQTVVKRIAFDLYARITKRTPVDTGRARGSWTSATNHANRAVLPPASASSNGRVYGDPVIGHLEVGPGTSVVISNNLPYITALEHGHSNRAPAGMVKVSIQEVKQQMRALIRAAANEAHTP